ncbi:hypothetical protein ACFY1V_12930 [Streptomyces sp. NPDC001255]|uniref:hypothetical protein n=1 Tax=Streptomyces sp. NPDC001255 TaxID=3364550 RepID=UPI00368C07A0
MPFSISITSAPSGSVVAKGATDQLSAMLLTHAGFQQIDDWYGRRHRLASTTSVTDQLRHLPKASPSPARRTRPASPANPAATAPAALQSPPCRPRTH